MARISRRKLAHYTVQGLVSAESGSVVMKQLGAYLVSERRTKEADLLIRDIQTELLKKGRALVTVSSARGLSNESRQTVSDFVMVAYPGVKKVEIIETIDVSLIGGVLLRTPDKRFDASVKRKLEKLTVR